MADELDKAQEEYEGFLDKTIAARRLTRNFKLPECENQCGQLVFVTPQGTRARFCRKCWEEFKADKQG